MDLRQQFCMECHKFVNKESHLNHQESITDQFKSDFQIMKNQNQDDKVLNMIRQLQILKQTIELIIPDQLVQNIQNKEELLKLNLDDEYFNNIIENSFQTNQIYYDEDNKLKFNYSAVRQDISNLSSHQVGELIENIDKRIGKIVNLFSKLQQSILYNSPYIQFDKGHGNYNNNEQVFLSDDGGQADNNKQKSDQNYKSQKSTVSKQIVCKNEFVCKDEFQYTPELKQNQRKELLNTIDNHLDFSLKNNRLIDKFELNDGDDEENCFQSKKKKRKQSDSSFAYNSNQENEEEEYDSLNISKKIKLTNSSNQNKLIRQSYQKYKMQKYNQISIPETTLMYKKIPKERQKEIVREVLFNKQRGISFKDSVSKYGIPTPTLTYWIQKFKGKIQV